jgi:hypothetical protein
MALSRIACRDYERGSVYGKSVLLRLLSAEKAGYFYARGRRCIQKIIE